MPTFRPLLIGTVIGSLTLVGCAQPNGKPMITFMKNAQPLSGKWYGQVTCSNGEVSKLSLDVNGTASGKLSGALAITQSNNRSGVFSFDGQFEQDATFRLTPMQWQQKTGNPSSLVLTGKADNVNQPTVIRGNVPECGGTFELGRTPLTNVPSKTKFSETSQSQVNNNINTDPTQLIGTYTPARPEAESYSSPSALLQLGFIGTRPFSYVEKDHKGKKVTVKGIAFDYFGAQGGATKNTKGEYENSKKWMIYLAAKGPQQWLIVIEDNNSRSQITDVKPVVYDKKSTFQGSVVGEAGGSSCISGKSKLPELGYDFSIINIQFGYLPKPKFHKGKEEEMGGWHKNRWTKEQTVGRVWEINTRTGKLSALPADEFRCEGGWSE